MYHYWFIKTNNWKWLLESAASIIKPVRASVRLPFSNSDTSPLFHLPCLNLSHFFSNLSERQMKSCCGRGCASWTCAPAKTSHDMTFWAVCCSHHAAVCHLHDWSVTGPLAPHGSASVDTADCSTWSLNDSLYQKLRPKWQCLSLQTWMRSREEPSAPLVCYNVGKDKKKEVKDYDAVDPCSRCCSANRHVCSSFYIIATRPDIKHTRSVAKRTTASPQFGGEGQEESDLGTRLKLCSVSKCRNCVWMWTVVTSRPFLQAQTATLQLWRCPRLMQ